MECVIKPLVRPPLRLLPLQSEHAAYYIALVNEPSIGPRINMPLPFRQTDFEAQLARGIETKNLFVWMIEYEGNLCGVINTADPRSIGVYQGGYWIDPAFRGKSVVSNALTMVKDFLWSECAAIRIQAMVEPDNPASMRVMEKCGYTREGLLRRFYPSLTRGLIDVYMYAIVKEQNDG